MLQRIGPLIAHSCGGALGECANLCYDLLNAFTDSHIHVGVLESMIPF